MCVGAIAIWIRQGYYRMMVGWLRSLSGNWDALVALLLVYAVIAIYLGPGFFFAAWFLNGCAYIIHVALRR